MRLAFIGFLSSLLLLIPGMPAAAELSLTEETQQQLFELLVTPTDPLMQPAPEHTFTLRLENMSETQLPEGRAQFRLSTEAVTELSLLTATETPEGIDSEAVTLINTPALEPGEIFESVFAVDSSQFPLDSSSDPGAYLTESRWSATGLFVGAPALDSHITSPLVWRGASLEGSLGLATIIPVIFPESDKPALSAVEVDETLAEDRKIERSLAIAQEYSAALAIDPKIMAYVGSLGGSASEGSRNLVQAITEGDLDSFALQYGDADPALQAKLLPDGILQPTGTSFLTRFHTSQFEQVESDHARSDPSHSSPSLSDGSTPPAISELLTWETSLSDVAWPAPGTVTASTINQLANQGFSSVVLSGSSGNGAARGALAGTTLFNSELALEAVAQDLLLAEDSFQTDRARADLAAITAVLSQSESEAQALLALDRATTNEAEALGLFFDEVSALPWVYTTPLNMLQEGKVMLTGAEVSDTVTSSLDAALLSAEEVAEYSRVLEEPQLLIDYQRDRLLTLFSVSTTTSPEEVLQERVDEHLKRDIELRQGVKIVDTENTRLLGVSSLIPVQLRNTLPFSAAVQGSLSTGSAALIVEDPKIPQTIIPPESTLNHLVSVTSRVSSGETSLTVNLTDIHEQKTVATNHFQITLSGDTEQIALAVLALLVVALFAGGLWRSFSRKRRVTNFVADPEILSGHPSEVS